MKAGIYTRISLDQTDEEHDDHGAGVERQRQECQKFAQELGWDVVEIYEDNDASATSGKVREHYERMLSDIRAGRIEAVVAWHTDRLYRRLPDLEELAKVCEAHSTAVRTCRSGELDMSTPTGRMIARILGSVATYEVEQKADRWKQSVRQRREKGRWWNSANRMFGYTREGEVVPGEAEALRHVVDLLLSGTSVVRACDWLAENGWTTTRGNAWMPPSLRATLRSPKIAGLSALNGQIFREGEWEPILDRATWEQVVAALRTRKPQGPNPRWSLLGGVVFCGVEGCGRRLYRGKRRDHNGAQKDRPIYRCQTELRANGHVAIAAEPLEEMVESYARERLSDPRVRQAIAARLSNAGAHAATLTREIDELDAEIRELSAALRDAGARSKIEITSAIDDLDSRIDAKRAELATLTPAALPVNDEWPDDLRRRTALIRLVVDRVLVFPVERRLPRFDPSRVRILPSE